MSIDLNTVPTFNSTVEIRRFEIDWAEQSFSIVWYLESSDGKQVFNSCSLSSAEYIYIMSAVQTFSFDQLLLFCEVYIIKKGFVDGDLTPYSAGMKSFVDGVIAA